MENVNTVTIQLECYNQMQKEIRELREENENLIKGYPFKQIIKTFVPSYFDAINKNLIFFKTEDQYKELVSSLSCQIKDLEDRLYTLLKPKPRKWYNFFK